MTWVGAGRPISSSSPVSVAAVSVGAVRSGAIDGSGLTNGDGCRTPTAVVAPMATRSTRPTTIRWMGDAVLHAWLSRRIWTLPQCASPGIHLERRHPVLHAPGLLGTWGIVGGRRDREVGGDDPHRPDR